MEIYWLKEIQSMWETSDHCLASLPCCMSVEREPVNFLWDVFISHIYSDISFITLILLNSMLSQLIWCRSKRRWNICVLPIFGLLVVLWLFMWKDNSFITIQDSCIAFYCFPDLNLYWELLSEHTSDLWVYCVCFSMINKLFQRKH